MTIIGWALMLCTAIGLAYAVHGEALPAFSLEDRVMRGNREARRRLILLMIVATMLCMA
jgi:hypothetical protein